MEHSLTFEKFFRGFLKEIEIEYSGNFYAEKPAL